LIRLAHPAWNARKIGISYEQFLCNTAGDEPISRQYTPEVRNRYQHGPSPEPNYLVDTLNNLQRSGVFSSRYPGKVNVVDTGRGSCRDSARFVCSQGFRVITPLEKEAPDNAPTG
jgi:hypothetical protein